MSQQDTVWSILPHTKAKHDLLRSYLGAWIAIFGHSAQRKVNFIDGFAGPGVYAAGEPGSPVVAIRTFLDHTAATAISGTQFNFMFNEADPGRFDVLRAQVAELEKSVDGFPSNLSVRLENRNFHDLGQEILAGIQKDTTLAPTFFFIDPFGYRDVPLDLIQRLLRFRSCEMLIYFDFNSVNRFATAGNVDEHFEALFGTDEFKGAPASGTERHEYLRDLYERQLRNVGNFAHVRSFAMVPEHGHVSYYLFFCTRDLQAFGKMKAQMWKLDPTGEFRFEDRLAGVPVLFDLEASTEPLRHALLETFGGSTATIEAVTNWVIAETPFHKGQIKVKTLRPMQNDGLIQCPNQRRPGTYPDGTLLTFSSP